MRLDRISDVTNITHIVESTEIPLIATNRPINYGGAFSGNQSERLKMLFIAAEKGFEYVDIELSALGLKNFVKELRQLGVKPIISFHDFHKTPDKSKMQKILKSQIENGAEICKIVTTAKKFEDNLTLLDFLNEASKNVKVICFAMGGLGKISRLLSPFFGGFFTIASLEKERETAPGQMTIQELKTVYQTLGVT